MNISHLFLAALTNTLLVICVQSTSTPRNRWTLANTLLVYRNLDELLSIIKRDPSPLSKMLVETFNLECRHRREVKIIHNRTMPFIIIEGNHRKSQDAVGRTLAKRLNAKYVTHPAYCIAKYLKVIPKGSFLHRAFFHLSNYAANYYVRYRYNSIVVLNGYWMEQLAYTVLNTYPHNKLPPAESDILAFPDDLVPPDVTFFLSLADNPNINDPSWRWKQRTKELMSLLQTRYQVEFKTIDPVLNVTTEAVIQYTTEHLKDRLFGPVNDSSTLVSESTTVDDYC